ncbi:SapC family protein [Thiomicrospira microaerophila]|uniref:SapC family protein n=1 Tax=Thiomicrospira microaerophila TaxID=406020 RepID=UPI00200F84EA|nr:SapC family protein [Thiomicrospira microaerophila]UQB42416.1 SapC family protein [Thiomicrospira microaerophila]
MFKTPEPLSPDKHRQLKLNSQPDYRFSAEQIVCPIVSGEKWPIAREYIMVFQLQKDSLPLAIMGTQSGVNAYLGDGNPPWWGRYVPAHFRRYPFITAPAQNQPNDNPDQQRFSVLIDTSAPQLSEEVGQPIFNEDGSGTGLLEKIQTALLSLQQDFGITQKLVNQIDQAGLLVEQALTVKPTDAEPVALAGFRVVDQTKLRNLQPEKLSELIKTGALDLIYAHIGSLSNLQDGLLAKKASGQLKNQAANEDFDLDQYFGENNDDSLKF